MQHMKNDPSRAGQLAGKKETFGEFSRYAIAPVHTRFDALEWFVWDTETIDELTGLPAVVAQAATKEDTQELYLNMRLGRL